MPQESQPVLLLIVLFVNFSSVKVRMPQAVMGRLVYHFPGACLLTIRGPDASMCWCSNYREES